MGGGCCELIQLNSPVRIVVAVAHGPPTIILIVTLFGKTGLNENSVVMHFECVDNAF